MYEARRNKEKVSRHINNSNGRVPKRMAMIDNRGIVQKTGWDNIATNDFISKHVGNEQTAKKIAHERGIPICHVLKYKNIGNLSREVGMRVHKNNHGSQETNPQTGNNQYFTNNEYDIYQVKYTNGKIKGTKHISSKFYYDAPTVHKGLIHHFDGLKR